ncbi:MAG: type II toxin-antitoxin system Phd/YefM family antitoxin [Gemmatimonadota bacterium]|nr:type II toxin-antitoxin system Phd/YefM family antitoxin [Gemmatimonadota bacterium]
MKVYTYSEARQRLATLLDEARRDGEVRIRRRDGDEFVLVPAGATGSPLDVEGAELDWSRDEIVAAIREGRERH